MLKIALSILAAGLLGLAAIVWVPHGAEGWTRNIPPAENRLVSDETLRRSFRAHGQGLDSSAYETAFKYLLAGHLAYRSSSGALVHYPGAHGGFGRKTEGVEGYARFFPLGAAWLASGRPDAVRLGGRDVSISAVLKEGLLAGTRAGGPDYWGPIESRKQRLVESADVALGLWMSRHQIWDHLDSGDRRQVVDWLSQAVRGEPWPNNWLLFPIMVHTVLKALDVDVCCAQAIAGHYAKFKTFHRGSGWFEDPPNGLDFYNAWAVQYALFWFDQIDRDFDPAFIRSVNSDFLRFYKYLVAKQGVPMMGRSVCYRLATPVPLLTAQVLAPDQVSPGMAMRAMDAVWGHFVERGALAHGTITQGYCGTDLSIVDHYSGPASCLWSARSLVVALYLDRELRLLGTRREPLLAERDDFQVTNPVTNWTAVGNKATGEVLLTLNANSADYAEGVREYGLRDRLIEFVTHNPHRPDNHGPLYKQRTYSSHAPVMGCKSN